MIESPKGLNSVEAIAALPGIAGCWFGYIDFVKSQPVKQARSAIPTCWRPLGGLADACMMHSKIAGVMTTSLEHLEQYISRRYNVAAWASDAFSAQARFYHELSRLQECPATRLIETGERRCPTQIKFRRSISRGSHTQGQM